MEHNDKLVQWLNIIKNKKKEEPRGPHKINNHIDM